MFDSFNDAHTLYVSPFPGSLYSPFTFSNILNGAGEQTIVISGLTGAASAFFDTDKLAELRSHVNNVLWVKDGITQETSALEYFKSQADGYGRYHSLGQRYNAFFRDLNSGGIRISTNGIPDFNPHYTFHDGSNLDIPWLILVPKIIGETTAGTLVLSQSGLQFLIESDCHFSSLLSLFQGSSERKLADPPPCVEHTSRRELSSKRMLATECTDTCVYASDGFCDDGGEGALYDVCDIGTDCSDCGSRTASDASTTGTSGFAVVGQVENYAYLMENSSTTPATVIFKLNAFMFSTENAESDVTRVVNLWEQAIRTASVNGGRKLIVDLIGNGGGYVMLPNILLKMLFGYSRKHLCEPYDFRLSERCPAA
jgi:hypothetical protein